MTGMANVLLIDDDEHLGPPLAQYFERFGLRLAQALTPSDGLARLRAGGFDAAILDVMLPEMDGFALCRTIRKDSDLPILMLTARGEVMDRVVGLELGADDYLPKPFEPRELVARVQTILRRRVAAPTPDAPLRFDGLTLDPVTRSVQRGGEPVELTSTEFDLLHLLARAPGKVFSREAMLETVWKYDYTGDARTVDVHIRRLREKIERNPAQPEFIFTKWGVGYYFTDKD